MYILFVLYITLVDAIHTYIFFVNEKIKSKYFLPATSARNREEYAFFVLIYKSGTSAILSDMISNHS